MAHRAALVGRRAELERLEAALDRARRGHGSLVLLAGEAGVGKTRLTEALVENSGAIVLTGRAGHGAQAPYGPVVAALRSYLRFEPAGLDDTGPLRSHLALLVPELGDPAPASDRATLSEAVRGALAHLSRRQHALVVLDDLHWSDDATLELLATLAAPLTELPVLVVAGYRSDGLPRDHALRRARHELRRGGDLDELTLAPFGLPETSELLGEILGAAPAPSLARDVHDRTRGVPFFVEELARALVATKAVASGRRGLELAAGGDVPVPETVRDAVLMRAADLSPAARAAAEAAAVAGAAFDLELVGDIASPAGLQELVDEELITEDGLGGGAFRHALTRDALYADVPWLQRRDLHRRLAEAMESGRASSMEVATHWLGARDDARARAALLRAAEESQAVHAHRDAARAWRQALELWPDGEAPDRDAALEAFAASAELAGEPAEAADAWRELGTIRVGERLAEAQRRLAAVHDLMGNREAAGIARRTAAEAYAMAGRPADAAVERLALADYLRVASRHSEAIELARTAGREAGDRIDLRARALGLEGVARASSGDFEGGLDGVQRGLALALEHGLTQIAADLYQRLGVVLYDSADYRRAQESLDTALELCHMHDLHRVEVACVACMVYVLREVGEWPQAMALGRESIDAGRAVHTVEGLLGMIHAYQGKFASARRLLESCLAGATAVDDFPMTIDSTAGLAWLAAAEGAHDEAARLGRALLDRWERSEDHHMSLAGLRWLAGCFARRGDRKCAHAAADALTKIASRTGHPDALAALAYAIGETALADGDAATAAEQLSRALELHRDLEIPYERAEIGLRAGVALAASGDRDAAVERLAAAYRSARKLGARPLATEAAREMAALGESVVGRLGRRAAAEVDGAGLSRRELEVVRLVCAGRTNREIAGELFLSPRTVDMHVRNLLRKLDARTRVDAARRAGELGLLT
jgi:DNA-binding CsgD family transcriptional regulator